MIKGMRRCSAFMFAIVMVLSMLAGVVSTSAARAEQNVSVTMFSADNYGIEVGQSAQVTFKATVSDATALTKLAVYDSDGKLVTALSPDSDFDEYAGTVQLEATQQAKNIYHVEVNGDNSKQFGSYEIRFYNELTDSDMAKNEQTWNMVETIKNSLEASKKTDEEIYENVYNYLSNDENVDEVWYENESTLNFDTYSGISNVFTLFEERSQEDMELAQVELDKNIKELEETAYQVINSSDNKSGNVPTDPDIVVCAPYYGLDDNFTLSHNVLANSLVKTTGGKVTAYMGDGKEGFPAASVASFMNWDRYGIALVDSHGTDYGGGCCICVAVSGSYNKQDVSQGHLVMGYDFVGVRGSYIAKYSKELPNTIVYLGMCYGMAANSMYEPLINKGASFVMGFDNPVTFPYDTKMMSCFFRKMRMIDKTTGQFFTAAESVEYAIGQCNTPYDPYGEYRARLLYRGNGKMRLADIEEVVEVTGVVLAQTDMTLEIGDTSQLNATVEPSNASDYEVEWQSFDGDVVTVDANGQIEAISDGMTTIVCTVTDNTSTQAESYMATCKVKVIDSASGFKVTFLDWDDTVLSTEVVQSGEDATPPSNPTRDGYVFVGWSESYTNITSNRDIHAVYGLLGDANMDELVNTGDASLILRYAVGAATFNDAQKLLSDANADSEINTGDAIGVLKISIG